MRVKLIKYVIMALVVIAGIIWYAVTSIGSSRGGLSIEMESSALSGTVTDDSGGDHAALIDDMDANDENAAGTAVVYVCGAVLCPGVYELSEDARVIAAIEAAGGFSAEAAADYLNLARVVLDGEKIEVPTLEEVSLGLVGVSKDNVAGSSPSEEVLSININTATKEELMELPGIGESRALSIIAYREENGEFGSIEEIMLVSGIKEGAFAKLKAYIRVSP